MMGESSELKIGLIGFGEVGATFSRGWRTARRDLSISAFDIVWSEQRRAQAQELQVRIVASVGELVGPSSVVLCAVVPQAACDAARSAAPFLDTRHLYVDLTSVGPAKASDIASIVGAQGAAFAKLALMGAVAAFGFEVPCAASGKGAGQLAEHLIALGMNVKVLNDDPAAAATLKLCRSLFQKGFVALALEALRVAKKNGIEREVVASLAETWNAEKFDAALNRLICSSAVHSYRRAAELEEAISAFGELDLALPVAQACRGAFQELIELQASHYFEKPPKDLQQVLDALDK